MVSLIFAATLVFMPMIVEAKTAKEFRAEKLEQVKKREKYDGKFIREDKRPSESYHRWRINGYES